MRTAAVQAAKLAAEFCLSAAVSGGKVRTAAARRPSAAVFCFAAAISDENAKAAVQAAELA